MLFLLTRRPGAQQGKQRRWCLSVTRAPQFRGRNLGPRSPCGDVTGDEMHSILLMIRKPEKETFDTDQAWQSIVFGLQQRAARVRGVITLCENCWLIPAREKGLSFFDHAIAVAGDARLHCRICLLRPPDDGTVPRPKGEGGGRPNRITVRPLQGIVNRVLGWMARAGRVLAPTLVH